MQIVTIAQFVQWVLSNFGVHNSNNEIIIITYGRIQCFTDIICIFIYQEFVRIEPQRISPFFLHKFVSKKRALVLDGRFLGFNSVKVTLTLMKSIIPPPPRETSHMYLSLTKRGRLFRLLLKKLTFQICFLLT